MERISIVCGENHHPHLTCTRCQMVVEVDVCIPEDQLNANSNKTNFDIEGQQGEGKPHPYISWRYLVRGDTVIQEAA